MKKHHLVPSVTLMATVLLMGSLSPTARAHEEENGSPHPEASATSEDHSTKELREAAKRAEELRREQAKQDREKTRELEKQAIERAKAQEKKLQEAAKTARQLEKEHLATVIKDQKRLKRAEKAAATIDKVDDQLTANAKRRLTKLEDALTKISSETTRLESEGKNVTAVKTATETAMASLLEAKAALSILEAKEYTVTVTEETKAAEAFTTVLHTMRDDHKALHKLIKDTHEDVRAALKALKATAHPVSPLPTPSASSEVE